MGRELALPVSWLTRTPGPSCCSSPCSVLIAQASESSDRGESKSASDHCQTKSSCQTNAEEPDVAVHPHN